MADIVEPGPMMLSLYCTPDRFNIAEAANINMATRPVEAATQSVVSLVQSRINADNPHSVQLETDARFEH